MRAQPLTHSHARLRGASREALAGLEADLAFCHPAILGLTRIDPELGSLELVIDADLASDADDLQRQLSAVIELSVKSYRFVEPVPPLWHHPAARRYRGGAAELAAFLARWTRQLGPGQWALIGPAAELRARLDDQFRGLARQAGAESWHLPSIEMAADLIPKSGYFSSHPQHVTFGYRLPAHFERLSRFAAAAREKQLAAPEDSHDLEPTGFILEPFVCHNVYRALSGDRLAAGKSITALGTCWRCEGYRYQALLRQWEFSMREVVLVGSPDYVRKQRERVLDLTQMLVRDLDIEAALEVASDPFFVSEAASARTYQITQTTKLELRLRVDDATLPAAASFNLHGQHFTEPMDIRDDKGELLETACVGFGLERWMAAFVARWGGDPDGWPA